MTTTTANRRSNRQESYLKVFTTRDAARDWMKMKNRTNRLPRHLWVVVEHPEGWAVVDVRTAIEAGFGYEWAN